MSEEQWYDFYVPDDFQLVDIGIILEICWMGIYRSHSPLEILRRITEKEKLYDALKKQSAL